MTDQDTAPAIAYRIAPGAKKAGVSRAKLYHENKLKRIEFVKIDGCTLVRHDELVRWFNSRAKPMAA